MDFFVCLFFEGQSFKCFVPHFSPCPSLTADFANILKLSEESFKIFPASGLSAQQPLLSATFLFLSSLITIHFYFTVSHPFCVSLRTVYFGKDSLLSCIQSE